MLRTRLFLNLLPFVVILMAIGLYAIVLFGRLANSVDTTVTENYRSVLAAQAMTVALAGMEQEAWNMAGKQNAASKVFTQHRQRFDANLAAQLENVSLPGEREMTRQLATNYIAFKSAVTELASTVKPENQHQVYEQQLAPVVLKLNFLLEKMRKLNHQAIVATSQNIQNINREVSRLMVIGMVVALIISSYACYRLSRSILQPIQSLTKATRELGEGNLGQPLPIGSGDELGELAVAFNRMAAKLQEYRQSTTAELGHLHRAMEAPLATFPDPIFVLDRQGRIDLKNPAANDLGASLRLENELPVRLRALAQKTLQSGENFLPHSFKEVASYRLNGADKFFLPRILAMRDKEDSMFGVAVVLYDVTRFRLLDAAKTNLVATVSHELKTPLTNVRMTLHILLAQTIGALTPKQDELLQAARDDTERLLRILNDLLDLARLEEGNAELHSEQVAPTELLQMVIEEMTDTASARGLKLSCNLEPGL